MLPEGGATPKRRRKRRLRNFIPVNGAVSSYSAYYSLLLPPCESREVSSGGTAATSAPSRSQLLRAEAEMYNRSPSCAAASMIE